MPTSIVASAIIAFVSTTMDDFAVMLLFLSRAQQMDNVNLGYMKVVIGQTVGFTIVVLISLIGMLAGIFIPAKYVNLIGLLPLYVGFEKAYELLTEGGHLDSCCPNESNHSPAENIGKSSYFQLEPTERSPGIELPSQNASTEIDDDAKVESCLDVSNNDNEDELPESNALSRFVNQSCSSWMDAFTLEVTVYALVCSSDNIGIYVAIFASMNAFQVTLSIIVFYIMLAFNILVAIFLMEVRYWFNFTF